MPRIELELYADRLARHAERLRDDVDGARLRLAWAELEGRVVLPDLAQVTGWSNADPAKAPHHAGRALFGGWRMAEMEKKRSASCSNPHPAGASRRLSLSRER